MRKTSIRYRELRSFLERLGFQVQKEKKGWRFEHSTSGIIFLFRPYRPNDFVYEFDAFEVRSALDWNGLVAAEVFNDSLTKTPA